MNAQSLLCLVLTLIITSCESENAKPTDPKNAFLAAREEYDRENYDLSLSSLAEFKTRFPYSQYAIEAELMLADANFHLERYPEAAASFEHFISLHPRHEKTPYAHYQVGHSYWAQAPESVDREQELTEHAIKAWSLLLLEYPDNEWAKKARHLVLTGEERIAKNEAVAATFYCEQEVWHACAYRSLYVAENFARFQSVASKAAAQAADAFEHLADERAVIKDDKKARDSNLFFRHMTPQQLRDKANQMRKIQAKIDTSDKQHPA
ncbi:MAG: outer membrane protein assembly factor BamD [Oligoflexales bacterium]